MVAVLEMLALHGGMPLLKLRKPLLGSFSGLMSGMLLSYSIADNSHAIAP